MSWSFEQKRDACFRAPLGGCFLRADTIVIDRPDWHQVLTPSSQAANEVTFSRVAASDADRIIDETVATCRAYGRPTKWCVGYWTRPDDFGERLARRGFTSWDVRGMGCATSLDLAVPSDTTVEEVTTEQLDDYVAALVRGWSLPQGDASVERDVVGRAIAARPQTAYAFVARRGGAVVGTAALVLRADYGYLLGTQVDERSRGRGVYRALVGARLAFLRARSIEYAVTQAREATSAPMLAHLGFETLFHSKCYLLE